MEFVDSALAYMRDGFGIVNGDWRALVIALIASVIMTNWKQWIPFVVVAVVVHIAIEELAPVLAGSGGTPQLPNILESQFWADTGVLALGYLVIIGVFFLIKSTVFKSFAGPAKAH